MDLTASSGNTLPLLAAACEGEVVLSTRGQWPIDGAFTPKAILASLAGLRTAD